MRRIIKTVAEWFGYKRDPHRGPHLMLGGGCYCTCSQCVRVIDGFAKCVCPRCNQVCTGFGRLGERHLIQIERELGYPRSGKPVGRWYR